MSTSRIAPSILLDSSGTPKLADFGISKIKKWLESNVTLNAFASIPFCPPEFDDGSYTYTRDVFGFGALATQCLTPKTLQSYEDLYLALDGADFPCDIVPILVRALAKDP